MPEDRNNSVAVRVPLLLETGLVTVATVLAIKLLYKSSHYRAAWFVTPYMLIAAALIPTALGKRSFAEMGFRVEQLGLTLQVFLKTCLVILPVLFGGACLLKHYGIPLPLRPIIPQGRYFSWLAYQFLGVAAAEEVFFRGYLQSNILRLSPFTVHRGEVLRSWMSVVVSAAVFAISHCVILGSLIALITFFPGLIFGWLLVKTRSLLAPILFHGLVNITYGLTAGVLS